MRNLASVSPIPHDTLFPLWRSLEGSSVLRRTNWHKGMVAETGVLCLAQRPFSDVINPA